MAGIGFRLKKYFSDVNFMENAKGAIYAVLISSGPWIMAIFTIAYISYFAQRSLEGQELLIFRSIISYSFAAGLLLFSPIEMPLTRYLADKLFREDRTSFRYLYLFLVLCYLLLSVLLGGFFYSFFSFGLIFSLTCILLFASILVMWLSMIFLAAAKNYHSIVLSYLLGSLLSVALSPYLGVKQGLFGYVLGHTVGQLLISVLLSINLFIEFSGFDYLSFEFLSYFKKYKRLLWIGLFYYCGIWVDKVVYWFTPSGMQVKSLFFTNSYYDTSMFMAYVTIIPALAIFFVNVETNFYTQYTFFFRSIERKASLPLLNSNIQDVIDCLKKSFLTLFKWQSFITLSSWYFAEELLQFLHLPSLMVPIFRYGLIGAYLQVHFLLINIILLYFLDHKSVFMNYGIFFLSNLILSLVTAYSDFRFYGLAYVLSSLITLILSFFALNTHLKELSIHTFMGQAVKQKAHLNL